MQDDCLLRFCAGVEACEIRFRCSVIGDEVKGVLEVISSRNCVTGTRLENAEIIPSIGIGRVETKRLLLLGNGLR